MLMFSYRKYKANLSSNLFIVSFKPFYFIKHDCHVLRMHISVQVKSLTRNHCDFSLVYDV